MFKKHIYTNPDRMKTNDQIPSMNIPMSAVVQTFKNIHPDGRISAEAKKFLQDLWATYICSDGASEAMKKIEVLIDVGGSVAYYARKRRTMNVDDIQRVQSAIANNNLKALKNLLEKKRKEIVAKLLA